MSSLIAIDSDIDLGLPLTPFTNEPALREELMRVYEALRILQYELSLSRARINVSQGTSTLSAGQVVVSNTLVKANSLIMLTSQSDGGTPGFVRVSARTAGTSFTITSSSGTDTSTIAWQIFNP